MVNNKTLTINENFNLAVKNHQEGKIDVAQELYNQVNYFKARRIRLIQILAIFLGFGWSWLRTIKDRYTTRRFTGFKRDLDFYESGISRL